MFSEFAIVNAPVSTLFSAYVFVATPGALVMAVAIVASQSVTFCRHCSFFQAGMRRGKRGPKTYFLVNLFQFLATFTCTLWPERVSLLSANRCKLLTCLACLTNCHTL